MQNTCNNLNFLAVVPRPAHAHFHAAAPATPHHASHKNSNLVYRLAFSCIIPSAPASACPAPHTPHPSHLHHV